MTLVRSLLAALVALTLFVGAGAAAPTDSRGDGPGAAGGDGLPGDLPGPVPDFVDGLLHTIGQFLSGVLDGPLGPAVSEEAGPAGTNGG